MGGSKNIRVGLCGFDSQVMGYDPFQDIELINVDEDYAASLYMYQKITVIGEYSGFGEQNACVGVQYKVI